MNYFFASEHLAAFCTFLRSEFSDENIEFWLACEDFKSTATLDDLHWKAKDIYQKFIQPTACREVSLLVQGGKRHELDGLPADCRIIC